MARSASGTPESTSPVRQAAPSTASSSAENRATFTASASGARSPEGAAAQETGEHSGRIGFDARFSEDVSSVGDTGKPASRESDTIFRGRVHSPSDEGGSSGRSGSEFSLEASPPERITDASEERIERLVDSLCEYSLAIGAAVPSREMALAEFEWRNGWFLSKASTPNLPESCWVFCLLEMFVE